MSPYNAVSLDYVAVLSAEAVKALEREDLSTAIRNLAVASAYLVDYLRAAEERFKFHDNGPPPEEPER